MSAAVKLPTPTLLGPTQAEPGKPTPARRLLNAVRKLFEYGKELAASLVQHIDETHLRDVMYSFGTPDIARILDRIRCGLLRAQALEQKILNNAARLDAPAPPPKPLRTTHPRDPSAPRPPFDRPQLAPDFAPLTLPTAEQIAAKVRRQPIGAVIADICRDLGIGPNHPLWRELHALITDYRGNYCRLVDEFLNRPWRFVFERFFEAVSQAEPPAAVCATGPP